MASRPSRFDNRPVDLVDAKTACAILGVKPATLYTYVSRGRIRGIESSPGRGRLYLAEDVERLRARAAARRGHGAVAASALGFGEPVLDTRITEVSEVGPRYRGHPAVALAEAQTRFEEVAHLLWGDEPTARWPWPSARVVRSDEGELAWRMTNVLSRLSSGPAAEPEAPTIVRALAASANRGVRRRQESVAETVVRSLDLERSALPAVDAALVLVADHELNPSTFAARVAAGAGASLLACLSAALATFSGPRHGGAPQQIDALIESMTSPGRTRRSLARRIDEGSSVPGFGHPLYPDGDPRAPPLLRWAITLAPAKCPMLARLRRLDERLAELGGPAMTVDAGLLALAYALGRSASVASALFCVGRSAGWIAHVFEQRSSGAILRPRARYVG